MKRLIRNLLIFLFYLTTIPFWRRLFLTKPLIRVWDIHQVKDNQVNAFKYKLNYVVKHYHIITPEQFIKKELSKEKINLLITFDDGFESWFTNVLPLLKEQGIKAIFFINNHYVSQSPKLLADGHSLGGHSVGHFRLPKLFQPDLEKEVKQSIKSDFFAYPFGDKQSFNQEVINQIKNAGYKYAFTILPGYNNSKTNPYLLYRDSLDPDVPNCLFKIWLKGGYDWLKKIF